MYYIKTLLKSRQESIVFSLEVTGEESELAYISDYLAHEGVQLDCENIWSKPARRNVAKNSLNVLWDKFSQKSEDTHNNCIQIVRIVRPFVFGQIQSGLVSLSEIWSYSDSMELCKAVLCAAKQNK